MSAIFGFTFHIGRMTEVLTPDIYRAHWVKPAANESYPLATEQKIHSCRKQVPQCAATF